LFDNHTSPNYSHIFRRFDGDLVQGNVTEDGIGEIWRDAEVPGAISTHCQHRVKVWQTKNVLAPSQQYSAVISFLYPESEIERELDVLFGS